jgi:hypothetical protein
MNWLEFIANIVGSLAWPAVFIAVFYFLREPVENLLPLLQRLKYKEIELEFNRRVEEVRAEVVQELPPLPTAAPAQTDELTKAARLAETSPRAAVLEAWLSVEMAAFDAARRLDWQVPNDKASNGAFAMKFIERHPQVDRSIVGLLRELRSLRNQAAHAPEFALSKSAAIEYASSAARVAEHLRGVGNA